MTLVVWKQQIKFMKKSFKINDTGLQQEGLNNLLISLERVFTTLDIDFYIIGAIAREVWFQALNIKTLSTRDVDIAVYIAEKEKFNKLKIELQEKEKFTSSTTNEFVMFSPTGIQVDLLPFGDIEIEGKVMITSSGSTKIALNGFREIYDKAAVPVEFENGHNFKVCTLVGIIILKLISYDDRPEIRQKDIKDIALILDNYFDLESDFIYDNHSDLFEANINLTNIAARVIGRQIIQISTPSKDLVKRIEQILQTEINKHHKSKMAELMIQGTDNSIEDAISLLKEIMQAISEGNNNVSN